MKLIENPAKVVAGQQRTLARRPGLNDFGAELYLHHDPYESISSSSELRAFPSTSVYDGLRLQEASAKLLGNVFTSRHVSSLPEHAWYIFIDHNTSLDTSAGTSERKVPLNIRGGNMPATMAFDWTKTALPRRDSLSLLEIEGASLTVSARRKLNELASLKDGWDSRGMASAPRFESLFACASACRRLSDWCRAINRSFEEPFLAPNYDGSIQMEWSSLRGILEMSAGEFHWLIAGGRFPKPGATIHEAETPLQDYGSLLQCYAWYRGIVPTWPLD